MQITPKTTYAVRCMVYLKDHPGEVVPLKAIAAGTVIPAPFLSKILQQLVRSGFIRSIKGRSGGFTLGRAPEKVSVYDIVSATSGGETILKTACRHDARNCAFHSGCRIRAVWNDLDMIAETHLRARTLSQL